MNDEKRYAELSVEEIDGKKVFVATDETVDRQGEVISIDGWLLDNFKRNPVLLWSHNPQEPNIGRVENIRFRNVGGKKKMTFEPVFHKLSDLSKLIGQMVEEGFMNTVSVGFRPFEMEGNKFTKQEMLEISFVNIPANPEATQLALSKGFNTDTVKTLFTDNEIKEESTESEKEENQDNSEILKELAELKKQVSLQNIKIEQLQVSHSEKAQAEPTSRSVKGRQDKQAIIKQLVQTANKSLSKALELSKNG